MCEGAVKCALRDLRREEATVALQEHGIVIIVTHIRARNYDIIYNGCMLQQSENMVVLA